MRRLPIYFLIDVSESMIGDPILQVEEGIAMIIRELKTDPRALETAWVSIIVYAGQAKTLVPLQELVQFYPPRFSIGSGTSLSKGLGHLMYELRSNVVKNTFERKGDWKPIVFLFTDGAATDDPQAVIGEWKANWQRAVNIVAVSMGTEASLPQLAQLTDQVLLFRNSDKEAYRKFFRWVTDSIKTTSSRIDANKLDINTSTLELAALEKFDATTVPAHKHYVDTNYAILSARCQQSKRPYLIKYQQHTEPSVMSGFETKYYRLAGAYALDNSYYELTDSEPLANKIHSDELIGTPTCPCCGNQIGLAMCSCGGIHCLDLDGIGNCPWCGNKGKYGAGEGGFDISRTQG